LGAPSDSTLRNIWYSSSDGEDPEKGRQRTPVRRIRSGLESSPESPSTGDEDIEKQASSDKEKNEDDETGKYRNIINWEGDEDPVRNYTANSLLNGSNFIV
jgi:hypothetical protein